MPVPLLGFLICFSHEVHLKELWILLWKWKLSSNFVIVLALNLECAVNSLVDQIVFCSKGGHLEYSIVLFVISSEILASCSVVLK